VDIYEIVDAALIGYGWSTVEDVAGRAGLPWMAVSNVLTELVGQGTVFVKIDPNRRDQLGPVLVYSTEP
jgi:hypothetical protein